MTPRFGVDSYGGLRKDQSYAALSVELSAVSRRGPVFERRVVGSWKKRRDANSDGRITKETRLENGRFNALQRNEHSRSRSMTCEGEAMIPHAAVVKNLDVLKEDGFQQPRRIVSFCAISVLNDVVLFTVDTRWPDTHSLVVFKRQLQADCKDLFNNWHITCFENGRFNAL
uniref:Uncharacterized protein n=1 Tax=Ascaris lumbricoides TaxID=6252 RepID=A0A0M3I9Z0_ASCLU